MRIKFEESIAFLYPEVARQFHENSPFRPEELKPGTNKKCLFICEAHEEAYETTPSALIEGRMCSFCSGQRVLKGFNDLATLAPDKAKFFTKDSPYGADEITLKSSKKSIHVLCEFCNYIRVTTALDYFNKACPACKGVVVARGINDLATVDPFIAGFVSDGSLLRAFEVTVGSNKELLFKCSSCMKPWLVSVKRFRATTVCPNCSRGRSRLEEIFFKELVESYGGAILRNKKPLVKSDGARLELDFWLPELKLAFEVQDFATHSKVSDDEPLVGKFLALAIIKGAELAKKGPTYHEGKRRLAELQLGVELFDLWEDELFDGSFKTRVNELISERIKL